MAAFARTIRLPHLVATKINDAAAFARALGFPTWSLPRLQLNKEKSKIKQRSCHSNCCSDPKILTPSRHR